MKAAITDGQGGLRVEQVPEPTIGEYQVKCDLLFGSVCAGTDQHLVDGHEPFCHWLQYPAVLGHESVGRVVELGPRVRYLKKGDLITRVGTLPVGDYGVGWGGFAEVGVGFDYQAMREDGLPESQWKQWTMQKPIPGSLDPAAVTMFTTWRETLSYIRRMGVAGDASVLVIGSGGNGLAFANHARNLGATTIAMLGSPRRADRAERAGVRHFIDYRVEDAAEQLAALAPDGYDFVIDSVGKAASIAAAVPQLAVDGTIGIYGMDEVAASAIPWGAARGDFRVKSNQYDEADTHDAVLHLFEIGKLDPTIWLELDEPYPLDNIADAIQAVRDRERVKPLVKLTDI